MEDLSVYFLSLETLARDECLRPSLRFAEIREHPLPKCADSDEIEYTTVSVGAAVMSRKVLPRLYLCLLAFFVSTIHSKCYFFLSYAHSCLSMRGLKEKYKIDRKGMSLGKSKRQRAQLFGV